MTLFQEAIFHCKAVQRPYRELQIAPVPLLGFVLVGLQILDGWLTYCGVLRFGLDVEGNPLVLSAMQHYGVIGGLVIAKGVASILLFAVLSVAQKIRWVPYALTGIGGTYLFAAVIPWITLLNVAG